MSASIWNPAGTTVPTANADNTLKYQEFTATAGQTVFTLTDFTYATGTDSLLVYINGVDQVITQDYTETSSTVVTLVTAAELGDQVVIRGYVGGTAAVAASTSATAAAASAAAAAAAEAAILALSLPNLPLTAINGGTGLSSNTPGALLYQLTTSQAAALSPGAVTSVLQGGGTGQPPVYTTAPVVNLSNATALPLTTAAIPALGTAQIAALTTATGSAGSFVVNGGAGGTPSSINLANATALPLTTAAIPALGTAQIAALSTTIGTAGAFVVNGGAMGTPSGGTLTNCTGLPITGVSDYSTGSYTGTLTGCTTTPTTTIYYTKIGAIVVLNNHNSALQATSNTTACTITGAPAGIYPANASTTPAINAIDGSVSTLAGGIMGTNGTWTGRPSSGGNWSNSGVKGFEVGFCASYTTE